ncbi:MAG: hypothetical protein AB7T06_23335 [Kofleriaceae bacterium]
MKLAAIITVLAAGCAGELENPARFTDCPPGQVEQMFQAKCTSADGMGCHGANMPDAELDLVSPGVGERVKGLTSTNMCEGRALVEADPMANHLMVEKLEEDPTCGSRMPFGEQELTAKEIECVRRWVDDLATEANP